MNLTETKMKQRKIGATVKFYALTWPGTKYAYIGQAEHPEARFARHIKKLQSGKATQYMQNVFNKHGMPVLTVLDKEYVMQSPLDIGAHDIEQAYYAKYDAAGYKLVNGAVFLRLPITAGGMYRLGLRSTEISFYNNLKNENKC